MKSDYEKHEVTKVPERVYEAPELTLIGNATDVVLGFVGGGYDIYGMVEPKFEFEPDDEKE